MGTEQNSHFYDNIYHKGGSKGKYFKDAVDIKQYYPIWHKAYEYIKENKIFNVIDLGCGPGHFSTLLNDDIIYTGYDFSKVAIQHSLKRNLDRKNLSFIVKDLKNFKPDIKDKFYTSFEFFEHVSFDKDLLTSLNSGDTILFSVPNTDSKGHVRYFTNPRAVVDRYGDILKLSLMDVIKNKLGKIFLYCGIRK